MTTIALATLPLATMAACGAADDEDSVPAAACDAAVAFGTAFAEAPQDPAEFAAYATDRLVPIGTTLQSNLDGGARVAATTLSDTFEAIAETGDASLLEAPDAAVARTAVGAAIHDGCDLQAVDIGAIEYAYVDAPDRLEAGRVSFALTNDGVEEHEMVLFHRADDATETIDEILELPEEEMMSKLTFTGVSFGGPDTTNYVAVDLQPGTYFLVCFIPQGGGDDGPPHFMGGMKHTITVG